MDEASYSEACLQCSFYSDLTQHAHRYVKTSMNMEDQTTALQTCCKDLLFPSTSISKNKKVSKITQIAITHRLARASFPTLEKKSVLESLVWKAISKETENNKRANHGTNKSFTWRQRTVK